MEHGDSCTTCKDLLNRPSLDDCPTIADIHRSSDKCAQCSILWQGISILHRNDQGFPQMLDESLAFERNNGALRASAGFSHNSAGKIDVEFYRETGMRVFPTGSCYLFWCAADCMGKESQHGLNSNRHSLCLLRLRTRMRLSTSSKIGCRAATKVTDATKYLIMIRDHLSPLEWCM